MTPLKLKPGFNKKNIFLFGPFFLILLLLFFNNADSSDKIVLDDFEGITPAFKVPDWSLSANTYLDSAYVSEGSKSMAVEFDPTLLRDGRKINLNYENDLNLVTASYFSADFYNATAEPAIITLALCTGPKWEWHESIEYTLKPGWNKDFRINLRSSDFKTEATEWRQSTSIRKLNDNE